MVSFTCSLLFSCLFFSTAWAKKVKDSLIITWEEGAPNGQSREYIFTNGTMPGPPLVFDEDDDVEITVYNHMDREATVHWHGLALPGTPWSDGVIGLTQTAILPGQSFVYRFKAYPPGTHWYHSHERMSMVDGLYGAILVKPKRDMTELWSKISSNPKDIKQMAKAAANPELLVVSDWSQFTSDDYWKANEEAGLLVFCMDSVLLNGVGAVYCLPMDFLVNQTNPGVIRTAFGPGDHVSDKGCLPFVIPVEGGPWNYTEHPELLPPHMQDGCVPSTGNNYTVEVDPADGWVSLNFVAAATIIQFTFSIDEHPFWIYEIDGNYVEPVEYVAAVMSAGERFSILVKLDKLPKTYTLRLPDSGGTQVISGFANFVYKGSHNETPSVPYVTYGGLNATPTTDENSFVPYELATDHMAPWPSNAPALVADEEYLLVLGRVDAAYNYTMNTKYMYPINQWGDSPLLYSPNSTLGTEDENLVIRTKNGSWVDLILQVSTLEGDQAAFEHFVHKHGSKTWRIGQGAGTWNYSSVAEAIAERPEDFNLVNPGLRDTWITAFSPGGGYWSVLRYQVTNPGPFLFHCHVELHVMGGMSIAILDGVDAWPEVPPEYALHQNGYKPGCKPHSKP